MADSDADYVQPNKARCNVRRCGPRPHVLSTRPRARVRPCGAAAGDTDTVPMRTVGNMCRVGTICEPFVVVGLQLPVQGIRMLMLIRCCLRSDEGANSDSGGSEVSASHKRR